MPCPSETRFQAFVEGDLTSHEIAEISQHLDACSECRMLVGLVQPVPLEGDQLADRVGRYVLRRMLGKGGMGIVYEAVDPDLHRVVALKVLRSGLGDMQQRLLGEAEAMAMLSHPNVVTVYDVGRAKDRVFVVMELIRGMSLRTWLARERPTLRAVLDAFAQAGEGLAAAHRAGLVHRDFKPENVFVAGDGRVRVGDFGLAVACGAEAAAGEGSAGYMAPEQQSGQQADARSDQYSFCVALEEAARTSVANRSTGVLRPGVPRWLSRALARGTKANPADRFPSMEALVAALLAGRQRARRWSVGVATAFGAGAVVVGIALGAHRSESQTPAVCRDSDGQVAAVWNPDVAGRLEHVLRASATPIGAGTWRMTDRVLTQYAKQWAEAHRRICDQASRSRGEDTTALFARKVDCLSDRLGILRAVLAGLEQADPTTLEQAPAMLQLLPRLDACEDANRLAQLAPSPPDDKRGAVDAARKRLAEASATIAAGRYQEGLTGANEAWEAANTTGYFPVLAEAYLWVGIAHGRLGHTRESEQALEQAVSSATAGQARDLAVRAWIQLMHFIGFEGKRFDDGYRYADYAKTALDAMPGAVELEVERLACCGPCSWIRSATRLRWRLPHRSWRWLRCG